MSLSRKFLFSTILVAIVSLSGCASGRYEKINVTTSPEVHANCNLSNNKGSWNAVTPTRVSVHRSFDPLYVNCSNAQWRQDIPDQKIHAHPKGMTVANFLMGGVLGGAKTAIDMKDGAASAYPSNINIAMHSVEPNVSRPTSYVPRSTSHGLSAGSTRSSVPQAHKPI